VRESGATIINATISGSLYGTITTENTSSFIILAQTASYITSSGIYGIIESSSYAISASWAPIWTLNTGSTYSITSSWAVSSSWSPDPNLSSYLSSSTFTSWASGSTNHFYGTSSYATMAKSSSYSMAVVSTVSASWASASLTASYYDITYASQSLTASIAMPAAQTWYHGPRILLSPGTWLITAMGGFRRAATGATNYTFKIGTPTVTYAQNQQYMGSNNPHYTSIALSAIRVLNTETGITASGATDNGSANCFLVHSASLQSSGSVATQINAIKLA
jgi:hypothetical protein